MSPLKSAEGQRGHAISGEGARARWPFLSFGLLLAAVAIWLSCKIPQGLLTYPDELLTAERSREMLLLGRDAVHFNFRPSFAKPPLQYWLTTLTLPHLANKSVAVRVWPLLFGMLTAAAVGWLAWLIDSRRPWLVPSAAAIYLSCPLFSTEAVRALLDSGLTFFAALAFGFAHLARRQPRWWVALAIVCWLGALQKIPLIFFFWLLILMIRLFQPEQRHSFRSGWLLVSLVLALVLTAAWPVYQLFIHGMPVGKGFAGDDLEKLLGEERLGARPYFEVLDGLLVSGWAGGSFAVVAAFLVLGRVIETPPVIREFAVVALTTVILAVVCGFRSVRYVLPVVPLLCVVLVFALSAISQRSMPWRRIVVVFALSLIAGGFVQAAVKMHHRGPNYANEREVAQALRGMQSSDSVTLLVDAAGKKRALRSVAFYLFHGDLLFPVKRRPLNELANEHLTRPFNGVCLTKDFARLREALPGAVAEREFDQFTCWRSAEAR